MKYFSQFNSSFINAAQHTDKIISMLENDAFVPSKELQFNIGFVLRELFNNAVEHGNSIDAEKQVRYCVESNQDMFSITVYDEGDGFELQLIIDQIAESDCLRLRNRGLCTAIKMGWKITTGIGFVQAEIPYKNFFGKGDQIMLVTINENDATFKIDKDITANNVKELISEFELHFNKIDKVKKIVIDVSNVHIIDSIGITFLIGLYKTVTNEGNSITLIGCNKSILEIFKIMKIDEIFGLG